LRKIDIKNIQDKSIWIIFEPIATQYSLAAGKTASISGKALCDFDWSRLECGDDCFVIWVEDGLEPDVRVDGVLLLPTWD
jgi:hypothetical protein